MVLHVHRGNHKAYSGLGQGGGGRFHTHTHIYYILYISLRCHHQNDFCIKNESHFNVSLIVRDIVGRYTTTFEEKGEPKRY